MLNASEVLSLFELVKKMDVQEIVLFDDVLKDEFILKYNNYIHKKEGFTLKVLFDEGFI